MKLVVIESPYAGNRARNIIYVKACARDCFARGESPLASHYSLTQVLEDDIPEERELGIRAGLAWAAVAHATVVYTDLGISAGMLRGIEHANSLGRPVEFRKLGGWGE